MGKFTLMRQSNAQRQAMTIYVDVVEGVLVSYSLEQSVNISVVFII